MQTFQSNSEFSPIQTAQQTLSYLSISSLSNYTLTWKPKTTNTVIFLLFCFLIEKARSPSDNSEVNENERVKMLNTELW